MCNQSTDTELQSDEVPGKVLYTAVDNPGSGWESSSPKVSAQPSTEIFVVVLS